MIGTVDVAAILTEIDADVKGWQGGDEVKFRCLNADAHNNGDRNPSASISSETGAWRCYGCG